MILPTFGGLDPGFLFGALSSIGFYIRVLFKGNTLVLFSPGPQKYVKIMAF